MGGREAGGGGGGDERAPVPEAEGVELCDALDYGGAFHPDGYGGCSY